MATTPQPQKGALKRSTTDASDTACASPLSPLPQQLFSKMRAMDSRHSSQDLDFASRPPSLLGVKLQSSSESSSCSLIASPARSSRTTDAETPSHGSTGTCAEYEEWALNQINEARANPCIKMKVARNENGRLSLQAVNNSPAAIKELRNWLASATAAAPAEDDHHRCKRDDSLIPAGLTGVKIFSQEASLAKTVSLNSVESLEFVDPEVAAGGFWMDVGTAASRLQTGDSLDLRFSTETPSSRALLKQGSVNVLLPWDT